MDYALNFGFRDNMPEEPSNPVQVRLIKTVANVYTVLLLRRNGTMVEELGSCPDAHFIGIIPLNLK